MKLLCVLVLAAGGLLVAVAYGDDPKSYKITVADVNVGTTQLKAGEYQILIHRDGAEPKVVFTPVGSSDSIEVAAKVESADKKYDATQIHSKDVKGIQQISEIRIGGTKLRIAFPEGS